MHAMSFGKEETLTRVGCIIMTMMAIIISIPINIWAHEAPANAKRDTTDMAIMTVSQKADVGQW